MKKTKRCICILLLGLISLSNLAPPVSYASQVVVAKLPESMPAQNTSSVSYSLPPTDSGSILGDSTSFFTVGTRGENTQTSASKRIPIRMQRLAKKVYQTDEPVALAVTNPDNDPFTTVILNNKGQNAPVSIIEANNGTTTSVQIAGSNEILPGKYTIQVTDETGAVTTQDFTWGVLALNSDRSVYHPGETANLSMAVLDDKGNMVCDASLTLTIINKTGGTPDILTTGGIKKDQIIVNPQCQKHDFSMQPDYQAQYTFNKTGTYIMQLKATTQNGTHFISDTITVTNDIPFDVQRISATRVYPPNTYPMTFNITANRDFTGTITETVPQDFIITPATDSAQFASGSITRPTSYNNMQTVYINAADPAVQLQQVIHASSSGGLVMPYHGNYPITQGFGAQLTDPILQAFYTHYGLAGHDGVDFGLPINTPLYAVDNGTILQAGPGDYGTTIIIQHSWGESYYGHLRNVAVRIGQNVTKGELIGYSGESGEATGPHLHFGMRPNNFDKTNGYFGKIDPLPFLPYSNQASQALSTLSSLTSNILSASSTSFPTPELVDASRSATLTGSPTILLTPTVLPTASQAATLSTSPTIIPSPNIRTQPTITKSTTPPENTTISVLDKQILLNEQLANNAQTEKVKVITWHVNLKKGKTTSLGYNYQVPHESPQFYLLGPMQFYQKGSNKVVFQEQRSWQIASDDVGVEWYSNTSGSPWNGYSWQYRKKIDINSSQVVATPSATTVTFMEAGTDATQKLTTSTGGFYASTTGNVTTNTSIPAETGPRSIAMNSGSPEVDATVDTPTGSLASPAGRISLYANFTNLPTSNNENLVDFYSGGTYIINAINVNTSDHIYCPGGSAGSSIITTGTWYRLSLGYSITSDTVNQFKIYLNGNLEVTCTNVNLGSAPTTPDNMLIGEITGDTNRIVHVDDIYADNGGDLSDTGDIHVTAKLPIAKGASNDAYSTNGSLNGSQTSCSDSSINCQYVNERPLRTAGYLNTATSSLRENFTLQSSSQGDVDISKGEIIADEAWIYARSSNTSCTGKITNNGVDSNITLTNSQTIFTNIASTTSYPTGNEGVGMQNCSSGTGYLYEAGVMIAYIPSASLSNFPVLVSLSGDSDLQSHAQSSCTDVVFTDSTGKNLLNYELEDGPTDCSSGNLNAWVLIPMLSTTQDTIIYMYYGNPSAASLANASNVWDSNYLSVWHMGDNAANKTVKDSTSNALNATNQANTNSNTITGEIDGGLSYNGSSDYTSLASGYANFTSGLTLEIWGYPTAATSWARFFDLGNGQANNNIDFARNGTTTNLTFQVYNGSTAGSQVTATGAISLNTWQDFVVTEDGSGNVVLYKNGSSVGTGTTDVPVNVTRSSAFIAKSNWSTDALYKGNLDEARISNIVRSPGWIQTEYNNESSPETFFSLGNVETHIYAPTLDKLMRNGFWFNAEGVEQPSAFVQ